MLILLLPPGLTFAQLVRAIFMFAPFSSAYVAEIVRGGLTFGCHGGVGWKR